MQGKLIIFSGPSGVGKTTIVQHLLIVNKNLQFSTSATTRLKRPGEIEGKDYYYMSTEAFEKRIEEGGFLEYEEVYPGVYYGTLKSELQRIWDKGQHVLFDVDVKGAKSIKQAYPDRALAVFVRPPSIEILEKRIKKRLQEVPENLRERLVRARQELEYERHFDETIVNNELDEALKKAEQLVSKFLKE